VHKWLAKKYLWINVRKRRENASKIIPYFTGDFFCYERRIFTQKTLRKAGKESTIHVLPEIETSRNY
jgi:hypothetical protein